MTKKRLKKDEKEGVKITKTCLLQKKKKGAKSVICKETTRITFVKKVTKVTKKKSNLWTFFSVKKRKSKSCQSTMHQRKKNSIHGSQ